MTKHSIRRQNLLALLMLPALGSFTAPPANAAPAVEYFESARLPPGLPFSEAVRAGNTLYLSGQIGNLPGTLKLAPGGMAGEAHQALDNVRAVLESHGYALDDLVKCTVMLADMADWPAFNDIYRGYFKAHFPARSAMGANGLALGARLELDCIAVRGADGT